MKVKRVVFKDLKDSTYVKPLSLIDTKKTPVNVTVLVLSLICPSNLNFRICISDAQKSFQKMPNFLRA